MTEDSREIVPAQKPQFATGATPRGLVPTNIEEVQRIATMAVDAGLLKHEDRKVAIGQGSMIIMKGLELGLTPTMALDGIAIINGRTCVWGKLVPALVRRAGHRIEDWETGAPDSDDWTFHCKVTRGDTGEITERKFSVADAKRAKLWSPDAKVKRFKKGGDSYIVDNDSPWYRFPQRMLLARARGWAAGDGAGETLMGMYTAEEMQDQERAEYEAAEERGHLMTAPPPPPAKPVDASLEADRAAVAEMAALLSPAPLVAQEPVVEPAKPQEPAPDMEKALAEVRPHFERAGSERLLSALVDRFNEKYDGHIGQEIRAKLDVLWEENVARLKKK